MATPLDKELEKLTHLAQAAKYYTDKTVGDLDYTKTLTADQTIETIKQENGKVSVTTQAIEIPQSKVTGLESRLDGIDSTIASLDYSVGPISQNTTFKEIAQSNGKISVSTQSIQIAESQVDNLESDLNAIREKFTNATTKDNPVADKAWVDTQITTAVNNLDFNDEALQAIDPSYTISSITQTDGKINASKQAIQIAESQVTNLVNDLKKITDVIPAEAKSDNQLADKAYVNQAITTFAAEFRGAYNLTALGLNPGCTDEQIANALKTKVTVVNLHDWVFVEYVDGEGAQFYKRFAYTRDEKWVYEYKLDNLTFTTEQWAAITSGVTAELVADTQVISNMVDAIGAGADDKYPSTNAVKTYVDTGLANAKTAHDADITNIGTRIDGVVANVANNAAEIAKKLNITDKYDDTAVVGRVAALEADNTTNKNNITTNTNDITTINTNLVKKVDKVDGSQLIATSDLTALKAHANQTTGNPHSVTKEDVGLGNVNNTADTDKPVSTATQAELDKKVSIVTGKDLVETSKISSYDTHLLATNNPHSVTKTQVGLDQVDNTSDLNKPLSTAALEKFADVTEALKAKVDKVDGSQLIATATLNELTTAKHTHDNKTILDDITAANLLTELQASKLEGIESGAQKNVKAD